MSNWIDNNFLLTTPISQMLYHEHAVKMPIIDFHNHLNPFLIAENRHFSSITSLWLGGDHYKWRLMRAYGIDEQYITGSASDKDKFKKWAELLPYTIGSPIFHWSHLELARYFNIHELLNSSNAEYIFDKCNEMLLSNEYTPCGLLKMMNVESLCTTDDPIDSLLAHQTIAGNKIVEVTPTWRADKLFKVSDVDVWREYLRSLSIKSNVEITDLTTLIEALENRQEFFASCGCKVADIGITELIDAPIDMNRMKILVNKLIYSSAITEHEKKEFQAGMLYILCTLNHKRDWVQQLHIGPLRDNSSRLLKLAGTDVGGDSMADYPIAKPLSNLLSRLDKEGKLTKTILYNLNPKDGDVLATMAYNFNDGSCKGKMQYGAAWWFLDSYDGVVKQLQTIGNYGLLSQFVGMLTDSRSFMSFTRHEYFRRILCEYLGSQINMKHIPASMTEHVGNIVEDICYNNAKQYFG